MCFRYAVLHGLHLFATSVRKWTRHLTEFPTGRFQTPGWQTARRTVLGEMYCHLCLSDKAVSAALIDSGPRPFCLQCQAPWGGLYDATIDASHGDMINNILIDTCVQLNAGTLESAKWLVPESTWGGGIEECPTLIGRGTHVAAYSGCAHGLSIFVTWTVCRTPLSDILLSIPVIDLLLISDYHRM